MKIVLINTPSLPCPGSHYLHTRKFLSGFADYGYEYGEINQIEEAEKYSDSLETIFYISDHGFNDNLQKAKQEVNILSRFKESTFFLWHLHNELWLQEHLNKCIFTGEHYRHRPLLEAHGRSYDVEMSLPNFIPLTFAANIHPDDVGKEYREKNYDCFYVGHFYNMEWRDAVMSVFPNSYWVYTPPFISEEDRVEAFSTSFVALGFQHMNNKNNFVITERIFEALMYGALLFVDSNFIVQEMPEVAVMVNSPNDVIENLRYFKQHPDEVEARRQRGYDYLRKCGTYYHTCGKFLDKMEDLRYI